MIKKFFTALERLIKSDDALIGVARSAVITYLVVIIYLFLLVPLLSDVVPFYAGVYKGMFYFFIVFMIFFFIYDFVVFCNEVVQNINAHTFKKLFVSLLMCIISPILLFGIIYYIIFKMYDIDVNIIQSIFISSYTVFPSEVADNNFTIPPIIQYLSFVHLAISKVIELLIIGVIISKAISLKVNP